MRVILDELDRNIMHHLCSGIYSYNDLAKICNVTRGTVYRRVNKLENMHVISRKIMGIPDYTKLDLSAICIGMDVAHENMEKVIELLKRQPSVKFLFKTYGTHNVILIMIGDKGEEGQTIYDLREKLENLKINSFDVSIGFSWEKIDFAPC